MIKKYLSLIVLFSGFISISTVAQEYFKKGSVITSEGEKIACLINDLDWRRNPKTIEYKVAENAKPIVATVHTIKWFEIENAYRFLSAEVMMDTMSYFLNDLPTKRNADLVSNKVFLKVIYKNQLTLLQYTASNYTRFFIKKPNEKPVQLVYKPYKISPLKVGYNNYYKQQLLNELNSFGIEEKHLNRVKYSASSLIKLCQKLDPKPGLAQTKSRKKARNSVKFGVVAGLSNQRLNINSSSSEMYSHDFGSQLNFNYGVEVEYILPFGNEKFCLFTQANYKSFNLTEEYAEDQISGGVIKADVDYNYFEIPIGFRYYFPLSNNLKGFASLAVLTEYAGESKLSYLRNDNSELQALDIHSYPGAQLGFGLDYNSVAKVEAKYHPYRNITRHYNSYNSKFSSLSLSVIYYPFNLGTK